MRYFAGCLFSALLASLLTVWLTDTPFLQDHAVAQDRNGRRGPAFGFSEPAVEPAPLTPQFRPDGLSPDEAVNIAVYDKVNRGVVNITTRGTRSDGFFLLEVPEEGSGSGAVIDRAGHILTNFHVVEESREVAVTLYNGKTYTATPVGFDPIYDTAVIKVDAPADELHPIVFGDSSKLRVGMRVFAIGNPFGLERTMTTGIISSLNRSLEVRAGRTIKSIIQTDAAINPGNSGGPLLDSHGRLIGVNTAIASRTGQNSGVGFSIPANLVARVVPELIEHGRVIRAEIGILRVYETDEGLLIAQLTPDGPAEQAGLRGPQVIRNRRGPFVFERIDRTAADLIVEIDGHPTKTADEFLSYIDGKKPGEQVTVTVLRDKRRVNVPVVLGGGDQAPAPRTRTF